MTELVYYWLALAGVVIAVVVGAGARSGPLVLAYFIGLSVIHVPGALGYLGAAANNAEEPTVETGFRVVVIGLACLLGGAFIGQLSAPRERKSAAPVQGRAPTALSSRLILVGLGAYFVALPVAAFIPSATSLVSSAASLILVGFWSYFYDTRDNRDAARFMLGLAALPVLPLSTMVSGGFLGYGVYWLIAIFSAIYVWSRRKLIYLALAPLVAFAALSFAVAYFSDRVMLREQVWYGHVGLEQRIETVQGMLGRLEPIDFNDRGQVDLLLSRMNESLALGRGIERYQNGAVRLAHGATVPLWALIPRAVWPDKPVVGGGGQLVSRFTGVEFAEGTSVGAGQPLEFYMNFGMAGVVVGFFAWGFALARLDIVIRRGLRQSNLRLLLRAGLPGAAMLQPGGNLLEILVAVVASLIVAFVVEQVLYQFALVDRQGQLVYSRLALARKRPAPTAPGR